MGALSKLTKTFSCLVTDVQLTKLEMPSEIADARMAGGRYARGNVPIQDDSFLTPADLEVERTQMRAIKFL